MNLLNVNVRYRENLQSLGTPMFNCTHGDIRLESGKNDREGTLRVCISGVWSTVCNSGWNSQDAAVICRQLGFPISGSNGNYNSYKYHFL